MPNYNKDPMASMPDNKNELWDTLKSLGSSAMWLMDRPQQAVFQGARGGSQDFERSMHQGQDPFSAAIGSLPAMASGMWQGLIGGGQDIRGKDLTEGLSQFHEWAPEGALGTMLDITASPTDVVMPFGKLGKAALIKKLYGNQYKKAMELVNKGMRGALGGVAKDITRPWGRIVYTPSGQYMTKAGKMTKSVAEAAPSAYKYVDYDIINKIPTSPIGMTRRGLQTMLGNENPSIPSDIVYSKSGAPMPDWWKKKKKTQEKVAASHMSEPWSL